jgi:signal transduction histidine kinase
MGLNIKRLMPLDIDLESAAYLANEPDKSALHTVPEARELQALHKNGAALPILLRISPMELNGELYFSGVIDDLSKTKLLQAQLGQAQKMEAVGQLASGIAHEINTPIQYVGDNLKSLEDNFKDIISYQQALQTLGDLGLQSQFQQLANRYDINFILQDSPFAIKEALIGVERVSEIVKAMKNFSHVSTGQEHTLLNVHEALKNAITITRNTHKQIADVETDFSDQVDVIECDASELNQVFLNLIVNAVHAIEEQKHTRGLINITTRKLNTHNIEILISDNGAGIPLEIQEKVFNLFFTTKPIGKGTGQGLSLAYNIIVEKHHGQLFFESVPGSGTTFHLQLPIMFAEQA